MFESTAVYLVFIDQFVNCFVVPVCAINTEVVILENLMKAYRFLSYEAIGKKNP